MPHRGSRRNACTRSSLTFNPSASWGPAVYIALCIVAVTCFSPATPLLMIAPLFGVWLGTLYASIGLTAGASVSFLLARYTARPGVENAIRTHPSFARLDDGARRLGLENGGHHAARPLLPLQSPELRLRPDRHPLRHLCRRVLALPASRHRRLCVRLRRVLVNSPLLLQLTPYALAAGVLLCPPSGFLIRLWRRHLRHPQ